MSIKTILHTLQAECARCGLPVSRSHLYEALAAAFGYGSYAAFATESLLDATATREAPAIPTMPDQACTRLRKLGHATDVASDIAGRISDVIVAHGLYELRWEELIDTLHHERDWDSFEWFLDHDGNVRAFLRAGLDAAAERGNAKAHYVLALLLRGDEDRDEPVGSSYWHERFGEGETLTGAPLEWALAHQRHLEREQARQHHLGEAARLGHPDARVDAAEEFKDPTLLQIDITDSVRDPVRAADISASFGDAVRMERWTREAALNGDIDSIRAMVEGFDKAQLYRRWVWIHLARSLGTDLTRDHCWLVNEDGSDYDDDVGGPAFRVGDDGISLPALGAEEDRQAREEAAGVLKHVSP